MDQILAVQAFLLRQGLDQCPISVDLTDVVYQSEQPPLYIHFALGTQSESIHTLLHTDIGKDRLDNTEPPGINALALFAVDLGLHLIDQVRRLPIHWYRKIPG